jgi:hypothetical protein
VHWLKFPASDLLAQPSDQRVAQIGEHRCGRSGEVIAIQSIQQGIARLLPVYKTFSGEATERLGDTRLRALRRQSRDLPTCEWVGRRGQNRDDRTIERMGE